MLILTRQTDETIVIGYGQQLWVTGPLGELVPVEPIELRILATRGDKVRLGVAADHRVSVHRSEVCDLIAAEIADREAERTAGRPAAAVA
ncbi:MAG: carbon storage regulator [Planctomycetaceae bacterium]